MDEPICPGCRTLQRRVADLEAQVERLTRLLEQQRAGKRQAAPFAKGSPKTNPKKPGRKPGKDYGTKAHRPPPERIDEVHEVSLPLYSHAKQPRFQTSAQPSPPPVFLAPRSNLYQVPSGSASVGVGSFSNRQRSLKCDCDADRSLSVEAFHLAMNSSGVTRQFRCVVWTVYC